MRQSKRWLAVLFVVAFLLVTGCGSKPSAGTPAPSGAPASPGSQTPSSTAGAAKKDTVVVSLDSDQPTLDPHLHNERNAIIVNWQIFDSLLTRNPQSMEVVPHLAESYKNINDTTWEFKLRKGVKFHNGEDFDANTVKFSFDRVLDLNFKSPQRGNVSAVKEVKVVDPYTVQIITEGAYPLLPERLTYFCMVPPKYIKEAGDAKFAQNPIGTGPYKFVQWVKGDKVVLVANESYWKGAPKIKNLIFRDIPEQATALNELASGGVNIVRQVAPDLAPQIEQGGNRLATAQILRLWYGSFNPAFKPFDDENFRKAMVQSINVDAIIKEIFGGKALRVPAMVNPRQFGFDSAIQAPKYDPEAARALLAKSAYKGENIELNTYVKGAGPAVMDAIVADWKKVGINATVKMYPETNALVQLTRAGKVALDLGTWGSFSTFDADAVLEPFFHSTGTYGGFHAFQQPDQDKWIEGARTTLDPATRKDLYSKMQHAFLDRAMGLSLFAPEDIYGISKGLNYTPRSDEVIYIPDASWN